VFNFYILPHQMPNARKIWRDGFPGVKIVVDHSGEPTFES